MKKVLVVVAGLAVAGAGYAGYHQVQYEKHVQAAVRDLVEQVKGTEFEGVPLHAVYDEHHGSLFESSGSVSLVIGRLGKETRVELEYVVQHHVDTLLSGMTYTVAANNSVLGGKTDETITSRLFHGKPVTMKGTITQDTVDGTIDIPEIWVAARRDTVKGSPGNITWKAVVSPNGEFVNNVSGTYSYPDFEILSEKRKGSGFTIEGISGEFAYDKSFNSDSSFMTLGFNSLYFKNRMDAVQLGKTMWRSDWEIKEFAKSTFSFSAQDALIEGQEIPELALSLSLDKLNGEAVRTFKETVERAEEERWSAERIQSELKSVALRVSDQLIQDDPTLAVDSFKIGLGDKGVFALDGQLTLDHSKLSPNAMRNVMEAGRADRQFKAELRKALKFDVHVKADGQARELAYAQLQQIAKPVAGAMLDGDLILSSEDGVLKVDGMPL